jgi:excisionase family DNA binding protein
VRSAGADKLEAARWAGAAGTGAATPMLSSVQVARFCGVDNKTIHHWADRGKIPSTRTTGRHLRFFRLDVVDFLRAFEFGVPDALRTARLRVLLVDADPGALGAMRRSLARRFELAAFEHVVDGLLGLHAAAPEIVVLGDVTPLLATDIVARIRIVEATRHVRVVATSEDAAGADAVTPAGDPAKLREALERIAGGA